jgi:DNA polymerase
VSESHQTLWVDIETRCTLDLTKVGVYRYASDPSFKILMAAWATDTDRSVRVATKDEDIWSIPGLFDPSVVKVAHNAAFERVCFSSRQDEYLPPEQWHDTMAVAAELGYPLGLTALADALGVTPKDRAGARLINTFCKLNRVGKWNTYLTHPKEWEEFIAYCWQDVVTLMEVDQALDEQGGWPTEMERQVFLTDQRINDRGIRIDTDLAREAARAGRENSAWQKDRVREIAGIENPGSVAQMMKWITSRGVFIPDLRRPTVYHAMNQPDTPEDVREVLLLRQELALSAPAKFNTALDSHVGGRLHGTLKFFGAHTGRWAGRGTQLQNLPRAQFETDLEVDLAILDLSLGLSISSEDLKKLVRPLFLGPFTVVDYAAIEARVIAWLAGEEWALEAFREGRDIYVETAQRMGGLTRSEGKVAVLALGYGGGPSSLRALGGSDGAIAGCSDEELYERFVYPWRNANPAIVKMWKTIESRFRTGGPVGQHMNIEKANGNRDRLIRLPSGRPVAYRRCRIERAPSKWRPDAERLTFWSPIGYRTDTYGGRLAENVTQAVARDILAEALVRLESAGHRVVAHVHDEILVEGEHDVAEIAAIMSHPPKWAAGMPIDGEGFNCHRYKKG